MFCSQILKIPITAHCQHPNHHLRFSTSAKRRTALSFIYLIKFLNLAGWLEYFAVIASTFQLLRLLFIDFPSPSPSSSQAHLQHSLPGAGAATAAEAQGPAADGGV